MNRFFHWLFARHRWHYTKPGWERKCTVCGRIEDACLVHVGMDKHWYPRRDKSA